MDFFAVLSQLNDLPTTFTRNGAPYTQLMDSITGALSLFTLTEDATFTQVLNFTNAVNGWLDVWGLLLGVPRNQNESDVSYSPRIFGTVSAWVGTVPAIQFWLNLYAPGGVITENVGTVGYTLTFPPLMTTVQIENFLITLNRIRPAGVPFIAQQNGIGLYLGTDEFTGDGRVVGNYLTRLESPVGLIIPASTPNARPTIPTLYMTDPTLNPSLVQ